MNNNRPLSTTHIIMLSFLIVILAGSLLLSLPVSSADGTAVSFMDALFTATTATCVTGLVTLPTATAWSSFGQAVILILIQIGGLGIITIFNLMFEKESRQVLNSIKIEGFPGGSVVKNPPANAGDMGSIPGPRRSHMLWSKLSLCATTTEPVR